MIRDAADVVIKKKKLDDELCVLYRSKRVFILKPFCKLIPMPSGVLLLSILRFLRICIFNRINRYIGYLNITKNIFLNIPQFVSMHEQFLSHFFNIREIGG